MSSYTAIDFKKFWTVLVVTFSKAQGHPSDWFPELYLGLCNLLSQNPLTYKKIFPLLKID